MNELSWLEVSLTVNGGLAEAVADVFARFAPNGVVTEQAVNFADDEDEGTPIGPINVRAYLPAGERLEVERRKLEEALYYLGRIQPLPAPVFTPLAEQNWMEAWKSRYQPIPVGRKLILLPPWLEPTEAARIPVRIDPGMAFGTGTHPTTQLCLELLEQFLVDKTREHGSPFFVIDIGCGSGILSIAALKLGAEFALGVDIDEAAVKASRENARTNGVPDEKFQLGIGSVAEILIGRYQIRNAPLVLANILAPVIIRLFEAGLAKLVAPGGYLILAGILAEQTDSVVSAAQQYGLESVEKRQIGDWVAILMA